MYCESMVKGYIEKGLGEDEAKVHFSRGIDQQ